MFDWVLNTVLQFERYYFEGSLQLGWLNIQRLSVTLGLVAY